MPGVFGSRVCLFILIGILSVATAQDPFGDVLSSNSELWSTFQEEMKTLEEAAHRMNTLLVKSVHPVIPDDQEAKPSENSEELESQDDSAITADESEPEDVDKKEESGEDSDTLLGGLGQPFGSPTMSFGSRPMNFGSLFGLFRGLPEPWWQGENVCIEKTEKEEKKNGTARVGQQHIWIDIGIGTFEHCKQTAAKYICTTVKSGPQSTKSITKTYQCCEGFQRLRAGCDKVELKDVVDVLESKGSKDFATLLKSQNTMRSLADHNLTIFAPTDEALNSRNLDYQESNQIEKGRRITRAVEDWNDSSKSVKEQGQVNTEDMTMAHMVNSLLEVDDFSNEMVVKSLYKESPLRINIYPGRQDAVMTVNCARLQTWDNLASHARIHTIDRSLKPVTQSVVDILSQPQFSQFKQFLEQENLLERLENATAVTVFAPNNEAWDKLGNGLKDKYSRGEACIDSVLRHHILPLTLCAAPASEGRLTTADLDGEIVRLSMQDSQLMVDDKGRVVRPDIVATNGVVHELDKVLTPKSAKPLSDLLQTSNHTTWLSLLNKAGLLDELNKQENITMFVPTEQVLLDEKTTSMLGALDKQALRRVLLNHVTHHAPICDLRHKAELRTQDGSTLRITMFNPYTMFAGIEPRAAVQCAPLGYTDGKACHVVAHEVTRLLLPPNGTVLQLISENPQLSSLKQAMQGTQIEKELEEKSEPFQDSFTILAPTDEAFNKLDENLLSKLLTDKKYADEVIRMHILKDPVCCASITSVPWPFTNSVKTMDNKKIEVNRDRKNRVMFGNSAVETCDVIASDGMIHVVDNVMLPEASKLKLGNIAFGSPDRQIMLFGI